MLGKKLRAAGYLLLVLSGVTLTAAAPRTLTALPIRGSTLEVRLEMTRLPNARAGQPVSFILRAVGRDGGRFTGYGGTVTFRATDKTASLPADHTFTTGDAGERTFEVTFGRRGSHRIDAIDVDNPDLRASQSRIRVSGQRDITTAAPAAETDESSAAATDDPSAAAATSTTRSTTTTSSTTSTSSTTTSSTSTTSSTTTTTRDGERDGGRSGRRDDNDNTTSTSSSTSSTTSSSTTTTRPTTTSSSTTTTRPTSTSSSTSSTTSTTLQMVRERAEVSLTRVRHGQQVDVTGGKEHQFEPGTELKVELRSTPTPLQPVGGPAKADSNGRYTLKVAIPTSAEAGKHQVAVIGKAKSPGAVVESASDIEVVAAAADPASPTPTGPRTTLPTTGWSLQLLGLALALGFSGAGLLKVEGRMGWVGPVTRKGWTAPVSRPVSY